MSALGPDRELRHGRIALRAALFYGILSALWVLFSEALLAAWVTDPAARSVAAVGKGWAFVVLTALLLYTGLRSYLGRIDREERTALATARRLGLVVDTVPAGIVMIDADGTYSLMNDVAARLLGVARESVVGTSYDESALRFEALDGRPLPPQERVFSRVMAADAPVYGIRYFAIAPDGTRRLLSQSAAPLRDENGRIAAVLLAFNDVTEQYEAEKGIVHLNRIYSMLSQADKAIIRIADVEALYGEACAIAVEYGRLRMAWVGLVDEDSGRVRPAASAGVVEGYLDAIEITTHDDESGHGPVGTAARLGRTVISNDIAHDPHMRPWAREALDRGYGAMGAFPLTDERGTWGVLAMYAAEPGFFDAEETRLLEDLTEDIIFGVRHIETNAELRRTNAALDALVENSPLPIVALDAEARIVIWNSASERLFGWTREEVLGKVSPGLPPEALEQQRQLLDGLMRGGRLEAFEQRLPGKDGDYRDILLSAAPVVADEGPPRMAVAIFQDVTQRRQIEQLKADFISTVSHELRTPLTSIVGYSELLRDSGRAGDPGRRADMADRIHDKAIELQQLLEQLLEAASIQAGSTQLSVVRTDVAALVQGVVDEAIVPDDTDVIVHAGAGLTDVCVDRARMSQAIGSLLSNAFKYSPKGGRVDVDARAEGGRLLIAVRDTGVGIPAGQLERIFDLFSQGDMSSTRAFGGLGLGLYMAKQVVEAHGGEIRVESEPGRGSTFTIDVPLVLAC